MAPEWLSGPTLDFGSGHDLTVCGFEPCVRLHGDSTEPAWDSFSLPLSAPTLLTCVRAPKKGRKEGRKEGRKKKKEKREKLYHFLLVLSRLPWAPPLASTALVHKVFVGVYLGIWITG